jgi:hypothetical protein
VLSVLCGWWGFRLTGAVRNRVSSKKPGFGLEHQS